METKKEIRNYCKNKLNALVRDHNHYNKVKYTDAVKDYDVYKTEQRKVAEETENAVKKAKQQEKLKNLQAKFKII